MPGEKTPDRVFVWSGFLDGIQTVCEEQMERLTGMFVVPTLVGHCFEKEPH